jgi:hypothetical protein
VPRWLDTSHILDLGACWEQDHFGIKNNFGELNTRKLVGKAARARKMHMQRRKSCEECMQEYLTMLGLGFW